MSDNREEGNSATALGVRFSVSHILLRCSWSGGVELSHRAAQNSHFRIASQAGANAHIPLTAVD
jgi:hypothetical protein